METNLSNPEQDRLFSGMSKWTESFVTGAPEGGVQTKVAVFRDLAPGPGSDITGHGKLTLRSTGIVVLDVALRSNDSGDEWSYVFILQGRDGTWLFPTFPPKMPELLKVAGKVDIATNQGWVYAVVQHTLPSSVFGSSVQVEMSFDGKKTTVSGPPSP